MSVTASQVLEELVKHSEEVSDGEPYWEEIGSVARPSHYVRPANGEEGYGKIVKDPPTVFESFKTFRVVKDFLSYKGDLEDLCYVVLEVTNHDDSVQYFRKEGHYNSYDGPTWDGTFREVKAVPKTTVFYE